MMERDTQAPEVTPLNFPIDHPHPSAIDSEDLRVIPFFLRTLPRILAGQRTFAYASEVGESFRPVIPVWLVRTSYIASLTYVAGDVAHNHQVMKSRGVIGNDLITGTVDKLIWHSFASMILPAASVHTIVSTSSKLINRIPAAKNWPRIRTWTPTLIALSSIPFIIHPLDHLTDFVMDNTIRELHRKN